ncbi:LAME_0F05446g1_1 [Lachancea meyersii CBS 8951]|uniref:LAME_0F05446g1_1 n=1 Tax=Lachancea meyersii CBS 8951 TaxID=1266667 RepID=A0A1G4JSS0_9SACH|nr:LAME_0F05446g1_1 [Lachancea meyersii CBS 8951]
MDERSHDRAEHEVKRDPDRKGTEKEKPRAKMLKNEGKGPVPAGGSSKSKKRFKRNKEQTTRPSAQHKLVVRMLPPNLTERLFFETLHGELGADAGHEAGVQFLAQNVDSRYYVPGHFSKKPFKLPTFSRAYLTFYEVAKLKEFVGKIKNLKFTDDTNTSMIPSTTMSPYVKRLRVDDSKGVKNSKAVLEGTIEKDKTFQMFLKSTALMNEHKEEFGYAELSVIHPLQKALDRKREEEARIKSQGESAIVALTGEVAKEKTKKNNKNKGKTKAKSNQTGEVAEPKKKSKKSTQRGAQDKQNVVIIEEAGRRELQRRERIKKMIEKESKLGMGSTESVVDPKVKPKKKAAKKPKSKKKPNSKGKKKDSAARPGSSASSAANEGVSHKAPPEPVAG